MNKSKSKEKMVEDRCDGWGFLEEYWYSNTLKDINFLLYHLGVVQYDIFIGHVVNVCLRLNEYYGIMNFLLLHSKSSFITISKWILMGHVIIIMMVVSRNMHSAQCTVWTLSIIYLYIYIFECFPALYIHLNSLWWHFSWL